MVYRCFVVVFVVVFLVVVCLFVNIVVVDDKLLLGGGVGIVVNGDIMCILIIIGYDKNGDFIGFIFVYCGGLGVQIVVEGVENVGLVGIMVVGNDGLDYVVIKFDLVKVILVVVFNGFVINGIGLDLLFGQIVCKQGCIIGNLCGVIWGLGESLGIFVMQVCGGLGDFGVLVIVDNLLVGMIYGVFSDNLLSCIIKYILLYILVVVMLINVDLVDINVKNWLGVGFVLVLV